MISDHGAFFTEGLNAANPLKSLRRLLLDMNSEAGPGSVLARCGCLLKEEELAESHNRADNRPSELAETTKWGNCEGNGQT